MLDEVTFRLKPRKDYTLNHAKSRCNFSLQNIIERWTQIATSSLQQISLSALLQILPSWKKLLYNLEMIQTLFSLKKKLQRRPKLTRFFKWRLFLLSLFFQKWFSWVGLFISLHQFAQFSDTSVTGMHFVWCVTSNFAFA